MRQFLLPGVLAFVLLGVNVRVSQADETLPAKMLEYQLKIENGQIDPHKVKKICGKLIKHLDQNLTNIHDDRCGQISETLGLDAGNDCGRVRDELLTNWGDYLRDKFREDCGGLPKISRQK